MKKTMYIIIYINLTLLMAQPTFPDEPNQAPIGGIGILAAAGGALATWTLAGLSFAVWGVANLVPRDRANHFQYKENFIAYPKERKALIPKIW